MIELYGSSQHEKRTFVGLTSSRLALIWIVALLLTGCGSALQESQHSDEHILRAMTFNIAAGHGDIEGIVEVIEAHDPDLVGLQEVDVHWSERSDHEDQIRHLSEALGMHAFFGEIYTLEPEEDARPPREYGLAVLSKEPFEHQENHRLTRISTLEEEPEPKLLPGFPEVAVEVGGQRIHLFNTHLDYRPDPEVRTAQVEEMLAITSEADGPLLLLGDLNAEPGDEELAPLFEVFDDAWQGPEEGGLTYPADEPAKRIDYVLHSDHFQVEDAFVVETEASDHRPLVVDLVLE